MTTTLTKLQDNNLILKTPKNLLQRAIAATKQTKPEQVTNLLTRLTEEALNGTIIWDRNLIVTLNKAIKAIDSMISKQLVKIMHHDQFKQLEGSWRGLHYLVKNTHTSSALKIKVINLSKIELFNDLDKAVEFDQSQLFKKVYENEFGTPGGEPYAVLLGDYEFNHHPQDIQTLNDASAVAAAAFCPFIAAASPNLLGFDSWTELAKPRDLEKIFDTIDYAKWRSFRESADSRFVTLTLPKVLARLPYGQMSLPVLEFEYEETDTKNTGQTQLMKHEDYCWMNAAYLLGERLTNAYATQGWCTAIRGTEGGGKITNLPLHLFISDDGDLDSKCPTEIGITDRREAELSKLGFSPLCHYKNTDYAVFFGAESTQKVREFDKPEATANAQISARLPYIMSTSRFAHYLKVMARDKIGSFMEIEDVDAWLNRWILNYVNGNAKSRQDLKSKYPLADAKVQIKLMPGKPGCYQAIAWLKPWLQLEELTTSLRLVANIPKLGRVN